MTAIVATRVRGGLALAEPVAHDDGGFEPFFNGVFPVTKQRRIRPNLRDGLL